MMSWHAFACIMLFMLILTMGIDLIPICKNGLQEEPVVLDGTWSPAFVETECDWEDMDCEPFDIVTVSPAKALPEGWQWRDYDDGSGGLYSPEGKSHFSYDLSPYFNEGGIEYKGGIDASWRIYWGALDEFRSFCESSVFAEVNAT